MECQADVEREAIPAPAATRRLRERSRVQGTGLREVRRPLKSTVGRWMRGHRGVAGEVRGPWARSLGRVMDAFWRWLAVMVRSSRHGAQKQTPKHGLNA